MKGLSDVLVKSVLEGLDEGFCYLLRELREVETFECIDSLFDERCLNELFH